MKQSTLIVGALISAMAIGTFFPKPTAKYQQELINPPEVVCEVGSVKADDGVRQGDGLGSVVVDYCSDENGRVTRLVENVGTRQEAFSGPLMRMPGRSSLDISYSGEFGEISSVNGKVIGIGEVDLKFNYPLNRTVHVRGNDGCGELDKDSSYLSGSVESVLDYSKRLFLPCGSRDRSLF